MNVPTKRFTKNDDGFTCAYCGRDVPPLGHSCRNHCPHCLRSRHVDINPGDRSSTCGGVMDPVAVEVDARRGYMIVHRCTQCGAVKRNKACTEARQAPDDIELLFSIMRGERI